MKKTLVILTILLIFASMGIVSAEDISLDEVNSTSLDLNDNISENTSHNHTSIPDMAIKKSTITASGGTFSQLQSIINSASSGDTITFTGNYVYNSATDSLTGITINKNLIFEGNGHYLNGLDTARIFRVTSTTIDLTFNNLKFYNGMGQVSSGYYYGGGLYAEGVKNSYFKFNYCDFITNNAGPTGVSQTRGGGLYINSGLGNYNYVLIDHCNFLNNTAFGTVANYGSSLYIRSYALDIINTTFFGNGGWTISPICRVGNIIDSIFISNDDCSFAGYSEGSYRLTHFVSRCIFFDNNYSSYGVPEELFDSSYDTVVDCWWGTNNPDFYTISNGDIPETWVVMNFTNDAPFSSGGGTTTLTTTLNWVYNHTSNLYQPLVGDLPLRNVTYAANTGSLTPSSDEFSGSTSVSYTYSGLSNLYLNATIDNQVISVANPALYGSFTELQYLIDTIPVGGTLSLTKIILMILLVICVLLMECF